MAAKRPLFTENFSANLAEIETFLGEEGQPQFARFFVRLVNDIVPTLCRFPRMGRSLLERSLQSAEAVELEERLNRYLEPDDELRELIHNEYLILYVVRGDRIVFLSIKHHKQLSFDLKRFWLE